MFLWSKLHLSHSFWPQSTSKTVAGTKCWSVEQTSHGSRLEASTASTSSCMEKLNGKPSGPFFGIVNSALHSGHFATDPGRLSLQWPWRQPRQNVCKQGNALGLLKRSMHIEHVVISDIFLDNRGAVVFLGCYTHITTRAGMFNIFFHCFGCTTAYIQWLFYRQVTITF